MLAIPLLPAGLHLGLSPLPSPPLGPWSVPSVREDGSSRGHWEFAMGLRERGIPAAHW